MHDLNWPRIYADERGSDLVKTQIAEWHFDWAGPFNLGMAFLVLQIRVHPRKSAAKSLSTTSIGQ